MKMANSGRLVSKKKVTKDKYEQQCPMCYVTYQQFAYQGGT